MNGLLARIFILPELPAFLESHHSLTLYTGEGDRFVGMVLSALAPAFDVERGACGQSCVLHDVERKSGAFGEAEAAEGSGDDLVVTATRAEKIAEFTMLAAEAAGGVMILEAAHTSDPALDAAMVLFKAIVQVGTRPVPDFVAQHTADRPR